MVNGKEARRKIQQNALGKVNRIKEIRRREKDGLKIADNKHYVRKKVYGNPFLYLCLLQQLEKASPAIMTIIV